MLLEMESLCIEFKKWCKHKDTNYYRIVTQISITMHIPFMVSGCQTFVCLVLEFCKFFVIAHGELCDRHFL